jgi:signal transduction histidine kinase
VAGGVAHDLNNVLTAIVGYSDLLALELAEGGTGEGELAEIRAAADRAGELVEQVLSFARPRARRVESIDLSERVRRLEGMIGRVLGDDIELDLDLETDHDPAPSAARMADPGFVRIDPAHLERALLNLASNAKASLEGRPEPGRFRIATRRVLVDRDGRDGQAPQSAPICGVAEGWHVRLTARDNGCGMEPALTRRIFEPFFTTRGQTGGTGLGLATIAEVVRESRGGIRVESAPGEGTAFHLYFPISSSASARKPAATPRLDLRAARV